MTEELIIEIISPMVLELCFSANNQDELNILLATLSMATKEQFKKGDVCPISI